MICWGDDLVQIYNEAFAPLLGDKHPAALGQCVADCWANEWPRIKPIIDELLAGEELLSDQALPLFLNRDGYVEETYWNIYPNLILGADNRRQGLVLSAMDDTTGWCRTVG
jgi:hypothetical protein